MELDPLSTEPTDQDRLLLVFAYLGPLAVFSLLATRREFVKWHAKQGIVLFGVLLGMYGILKPLHRLLQHYVWWWIGELFWAVVWMLALGVLLTMMLCIVRALDGERFKIPVLGELADWL